MGKVLGWIVFALLAWAAWKFWVISKRRSEGGAGQGTKDDDQPASRRSAEARGATDEPPEGVERMVRCAHCDLHLPASDAKFASGKAYCSDEHLRLARRGDADH